MNLVVFGLSVSSSWGNGHASLWRALIAALLAQGDRVTFFERDVPYYAQNRDLHELPPGGELALYPSWGDVRAAAQAAVRQADVAMVTSYCPDALGCDRPGPERGPGPALFLRPRHPGDAGAAERGRERAIHRGRPGWPGSTSC